MKKNLILFLMLLALAGVAYVLMNKEEKTATMDKGGYKFSVKNINDIYKLFIADRKGNKVTLKRGPKFWTLDDKYRVNDRVINSTLDALQNLDISSIPPRAAYKNVMKEIATKGVKVEAYDKSNNLIRSFYLGGTSGDGYETQIIMDGYDQPYFVQIKGAAGEVLPRFSKRYDDWRDPFIFRGIAEDVDTFSVYYPRRRSESFVIARDGKDFTVQPAFETTTRIEGVVPRNRFDQYFYDIDKLAIEAYFNTHSKIDSLKNQPSVVTAYLKKRNGEVKKWEFIEHGIRSDLAPQNSVLDERLTSKYIMVDENNEAMLGQEHLLKNIFWGYSSFYNKPIQ